MRGLLIISPIVYLVLLYFVSFVITYDDYDWVPREVASLGSQCVRRGYRGSCDLSSVYGYAHRIRIGICKQLLCAKSADPQYVGVSAGPARIGTPCDVNKVCDKKRQCVEIPKDEMPMLMGNHPQFTCVQKSTFDVSKMSDCMHLCAIKKKSVPTSSCLFLCRCE